MIPLMKRQVRSVPDLLSRLEAFVQLRKVREGFSLVDELRRELKSGREVKGPSTIRLALCLAQWMDLGYRDHSVLEIVTKRLPKRNSEMSFLDVMRLNLVESYL